MGGFPENMPKQFQESMNGQDEALERIMSLTHRLNQKEQELNNLKNITIPDMCERVKKAESEVSKLTAERDSLKLDIEGARETLETLRNQNQRLKELNDIIERSREIAQKDIERIAKDRGSLAAQYNTMLAEFKEAETNLQWLRNEINAFLLGEATLFDLHKAAKLKPRG